MRLTHLSDPAQTPGSSIQQVALYRFGQDCQQTYGHRLHAYRITITNETYSEVSPASEG